ncbi:histone H2B-like [Bos javanicus]|uniref:histone H2B-like n=1 Tax=Bos javanicus TaxID=9906 RepID=UPI002AA5EB6F|nr:histone H2B-like [Bos javanicus]
MGIGGSILSETSSDSYEEDVITKETGISEIEPSEKEMAKVETSKPDPYDAEPIKVETSKPDPYDAEPKKAETSKPDPYDAEPKKAETSKPDPYDAEPKKAKQKTAKGRRRRRRHCHHDSFSSFATYFPRVLRQIHKGMSLSHDSVNILDSFVKDTFERIAEEAGRLAGDNKRRTITTEDIEAAVRLLLPGKLGKYAVLKATKSLITYRTCK